MEVPIGDAAQPAPPRMVDAPEWCHSGSESLEVTGRRATAFVSNLRLEDGIEHDKGS